MTVQQIANVISPTLSVIAFAVCSPFLVTKAKLIRQRDEARGWAERLEKRVETLSSETLAFTALAGEVRQMRDEITRMRRTLVASTRYTVDLILHARRHGTRSTLPEPPPEISDEVLAELRVRDGSELPSPA